MRVREKNTSLIFWRGRNPPHYFVLSDPPHISALHWPHGLIKKPQYVCCNIFLARGIFCKHHPPHFILGQETPPSLVFQPPSRQYQGDCVIVLGGGKKHRPKGGVSRPRQKVPKSKIDPCYSLFWLFLGEGGSFDFSKKSLFLPSPESITQSPLFNANLKSEAQKLMGS